MGLTLTRSAEARVTRKLQEWTTRLLAIAQLLGMATLLPMPAQAGTIVLFFVDPAGATMNVTAGFGTGVSFFYASVDRAGSVEVYDALGGTGALLASFGLMPHGSACGGDPTGTFNCWAPVGVAFAGTAKSIKFLGVANRIAFDDVTFGSEIPGSRVSSPGPQVAAPATLILLSAGLGLAA